MSISYRIFSPCIEKGESCSTGRNRDSAGRILENQSCSPLPLPALVLCLQTGLARSEYHHCLSAGRSAHSGLDEWVFLRILVSLLSVFSFNFFFTVPRFSLTSIDPNYPVTFLVMLLASCLSCSLATRVKRQGRQSAQRAYYMELLMNSNQKMQQGQSEQEIIQIAAQQLQSLLDRPVYMRYWKKIKSSVSMLSPPRRQSR